MDKELRIQIEEIISNMDCAQDFSCCEDNFSNVCQAKDVGASFFLECLEENPQQCEFSLHFGDAYFCQCPLRIYIAKKLKK
jgi:hypothetical protein